VAVAVLVLWTGYFAVTPPRAAFDPFYNSTTMVLMFWAASIAIISFETACSVSLERMRQRLLRSYRFERQQEEALLSYLAPGRTARTHSLGPASMLVLVEIIEVRVHTQPAANAHTEDVRADNTPIKEKRKTALVEHLPLNWRIALSMAVDWLRDPFKWPNWLHKSVAILVVLLGLAILTFIAMAFVWVMKGAGWLAWQLLKGFFEADHPLDYPVFAACLATLIRCRRWQIRTLPAAVLSAFLR
jgi:hypothetical protein